MVGSHHNSFQKYIQPVGPYYPLRKFTRKKKVQEKKSQIDPLKVLSEEIIYMVYLSISAHFDQYCLLQDQNSKNLEVSPDIMNGEEGLDRIVSPDTRIEERRNVLWQVVIIIFSHSLSLLFGA